MASVLSKISGGRDRVTLIGYDRNDKKIELEIDLVETFEVTYNNQVSKHTIEKDTNKPISKITDHVSPESPIIASNVILADNLNLLDENKTAISGKDKLKTLTYWQHSGSVLTLEGYTVGSGAFGKVVNFFRRGIGNFNSEIEEPYYAGTVTEKIENIVLGNIINRNKLELGNDIEVTLNFERVKIAEAMKSTRNSVKPLTGTTPQKKGNTATTQVNPQKPVQKSVLKKQ